MYCCWIGTKSLFIFNDPNFVRFRIQEFLLLPGTPSTVHLALKNKANPGPGGDVHLEGQQIERVNEYIYLGHTITLSKVNQTAEITRRIRLTWAAVAKLETTLKNPTLVCVFCQS